MHIYIRDEIFHGSVSFCRFLSHIYSFRDYANPQNDMGGGVKPGQIELNQEVSGTSRSEVARK